MPMVEFLTYFCSTLGSCFRIWKGSRYSNGFHRFGRSFAAGSHVGTTMDADVYLTDDATGGTQRCVDRRQPTRPSYEIITICVSLSVLYNFARAGEGLMVDNKGIG